VTILNLKVAKLIPEDDVVLVEGAIPGSKNTIVTLRGAVKKKGGNVPKPASGAASKKKG